MKKGLITASLFPVLLLILFFPQQQKFQELEVGEVSTDKRYGLSEANPVKVGGGRAPINVYIYLNGLRGPKGEKIEYNRIGSCCEYQDPKAKGLERDGAGILTVFEVCYRGCKKSKIVYFDQYRYEKPMVLKGFTYVKEEPIKPGKIPLPKIKPKPPGMDSLKTDTLNSKADTLIPKQLKK
jgi:hypothetical protein